MTDETPLGDHWVERRRFFDGGYMLIERRNSIAVAHGRRVTKLSKKTGETWEAWANSSWTFYSMKPRVDGSQHLTMYTRKSRSGGRSSIMANVTSNAQRQSGDHHDEVWAAIYSMCDRVGKPVPDRIRQLDVEHRGTAIAYPFLAATIHPAGQRLARVPALGLAAAMRTDNPRDFVTVAFGRRLLRKDLIRATATAHMDVIAAAVAVKRIVPADWLIEMMTCKRHPAPDSWQDLRVPAAGLPGVLALVPEHARRRLITDPNLLHDRIIRDAVHSLTLLTDSYGKDRSWVTPDVVGARTWLALHDALAAAERRVRQGCKPIAQDDVYAEFDGATLLDGRISVVSAKSTDDLHVWGESMSNCIAGYRGTAVNHSAYLYGVYEEGTLIGNLGVAQDGRVVQLLGRFNNALPDEIDAPVRHLFDKAWRRAAQVKRSKAAMNVLAA